MSSALLFLPNFYLLNLYAFYTYVSFYFSHLNSLKGRREGWKEREREKSWFGSLTVIQHEIPSWVKFSCAANSWITRQHINGCLGSGDNLGLTNLWQGLWCHTVKNIMTYLFLISHLKLWLAVSWVGRMACRHWPVLSNPVWIRSNAVLLEK